MGAAIVADTHTLIWHFLNSTKLSSAAKTAISQAALAGDNIYVASISIVEIIYLVEKTKIPEIALQRLNSALADPASVFEIAPLDEDIAQAVRKIPRDIVPDMPDRIIAATAHYLGLPLATRDSRIQAAGIAIIW